MRRAFPFLFVMLCSGVSPALSGPCGGSTGITCAAGQFCKLPTGSCDPEAEGVCTDVPIDCVVDDGLWVCGCDAVDYLSECHASMAGVSLSRPGPCDGSCGTVWGIPCLPGEYCRLPFSCFFDEQGQCEPVPDECPPQCQPVCGCNGTTYASVCEAQVFGFHLLERRGACGEAHGLHFASASQLAWDAPPGALGFNVYRNGDVLAAESSGPACEAEGLVTTTWDLPDDPILGELWELEVTAVFPEGEGPMGVGSLCRERAPGRACGPD